MTSCPHRQCAGARADIGGGNVTWAAQFRVQRWQRGSSRRRVRCATMVFTAADLTAALVGGRDATIVSVGTLQEH